MRKTAATLLPLAITCCVIGCTNSDNYEANRNRTTPPATDQARSAPTDPGAVDPNTTPPANDPNMLPGSANADNTAINERDRNPANVTPGDQLENTTDRNITQSIRKAIIADASLSISAKNVKIVTANGVVTLRGPVKTEIERKVVADTAQQVAGVMRVDNHLEVITQ